MSDAVLDASAILALLNLEPGHDKLTDAILAHAHASTVNLAEVQTKLVSNGWDPEVAWTDARATVRHAIAVASEMARLTAELVATTRSLGLSLGDRACLALALQRGSCDDTCERVWPRLRLPPEIHVMR